jgi:hypothetical protein
VVTRAPSWPLTTQWQLYVRALCKSAWLDGPMEHCTVLERGFVSSAPHATLNAALVAG